MSPTNHPGYILPQDSAPADAVDESIVGQPITLNEIEDLVYGEDRSVQDRLARLGELAEQLRARQSGDVSGDARALLDEIDRGIEQLGGAPSNDDDEDLYFMDPTGTLDQDPEDHLDALSPDDVDARAAIEGDDESDGEDLDVLDPSEWEEGDDFRPGQGVH